MWDWGNSTSLKWDDDKLETVVVVLSIHRITLNYSWFPWDKEEKCLLLTGTVRDAELAFVGCQMFSEGNS